jgi:hypothetical protein
MVAAIIQSHSAAVRRWVQAHAVEWLNGQTLCGIPDAIDIRLDEAAIGAIRTWKERMPDGGATAVSRWVAAYQFDERWAGNDLVEFALIGEAMFALLETFSDEIKRLSEVADDPDAVRRTRGIVHGLFLPDALARQKVAMGAARAAAALRDVHRWLPRDMVVAIWEFCLWFGGTPAPCPFP